MIRSGRSLGRADADDSEMKDDREAIRCGKSKLPDTVMTLAIVLSWIFVFIYTFWMTSATPAQGLEELSPAQPIIKKRPDALPAAPAHPKANLSPQANLSVIEVHEGPHETPYEPPNVLKHLSDFDISIMAMISRRHPKGESGFWFAVYNNSVPSHSQRVQDVNSAIAAVDKAIATAGIDVWDNSSCDDNYDKECPDWAAREPSECVERDSMLAACRRLCGYCGPIALVAEAIDHDKPLRRRLGESDTPKTSVKPRLNAPSKADYVPPKEDASQAVEKRQQSFLELITTKASARIAVKPADADAYIRQAIRDHSKDYPPVSQPGEDPAKVATSAAPDSNNAKRTCDEVMKAGREQTDAAKVFTLGDRGPQRGAEGAPKLLCMVMAAEKDHTSVSMALRTWGHKCDGFLAASTADDNSIGAVKMNLSGEYSAWQQARAAWTHVWRHYVSSGKYDAVIMVRSQGYVLPGNARTLLAEGDQQVPRVMGRLASRGGALNDLYFLAGAGVMLNAAAVRLLVARLWMGGCAPNLKADWDDVMLAKCMRAGDYELYPGLGFDDSDFGGNNVPEWLKQSITPEDTRDKSGAHRFMPFSLRMHFGFVPDYAGGEWFSVYSKYMPGGLRTGRGCCSAESVSFTVERDGQMGEIASYLRYCA